MTPYLRSLLRLRQDERLAALREKAKSERDPCAPDETVQLLLACARMCAPTRALEIGTGEGLTAVALLQECPQLHLVTVESDEVRYRAACKNFAAFGVAERVRCVLGDAKDLLAALDEPFGLIFLDGPKAQYGGYLPDLKRLLAPRGVLFADDVLLYGWVDGREETPPKRRSIVRKIREYLELVCGDPDLRTSVLDVGEGVAISVKKGSDV